MGYSSRYVYTPSFAEPLWNASAKNGKKIKLIYKDGRRTSFLIIFTIMVGSHFQDYIVWLWEKTISKLVDKQNLKEPFAKTFMTNNLIIFYS